MGSPQRDRWRMSLGVIPIFGGGLAAWSAWRAMADRVKRAVWLVRMVSKRALDSGSAAHSLIARPVRTHAVMDLAASWQAVLAMESMAQEQTSGAVVMLDALVHSASAASCWASR